MPSCYWPEVVDDEALEHDMGGDTVGEDFEPRAIRNWQSWLYDIWRLKLGIHLYAIQRVQWQLEFFGDVDGPEEPEEEP